MLNFESIGLSYSVVYLMEIVCKFHRFSSYLVRVGIYLEEASPFC